MADDTNTAEREALGFFLEKRGDVWVVQFKEGGCRPATIPEKALWDAYQAGRASIAARAVTTDYRGWGYAKLPEPVAYSLGLAKYAHSSNIIAANEFTPDAEHADEWESLVTMDQARDFADRTHQFRECRGDESLAASAGSEPVGEVESSLRFTGGFHVRLYRGATMPEPGAKLYTHPSPPEGMAGMVPVAEVVECETMGQQTLREIDGRWRWLSIGERLYAHADTGFAAPPIPASEAKEL
jgi:hypothetical protein